MIKLKACRWLESVAGACHFPFELDKSDRLLSFNCSMSTAQSKLRKPPRGRTKLKASKCGLWRFPTHQTMLMVTIEAGCENGGCMCKGHMTNGRKLVVCLASQVTSGAWLLALLPVLTVKDFPRVQLEFAYILISILCLLPIWVQTHSGQFQSQTLAWMKTAALIQAPRPQWTSCLWNTARPVAEVLWYKITSQKLRGKSCFWNTAPGILGITRLHVWIFMQNKFNGAWSWLNTKRLRCLETFLGTCTSKAMTSHQSADKSGTTVFPPPAGFRIPHCVAGQRQGQLMLPFWQLATQLPQTYSVRTPTTLTTLGSLVFWKAYPSN